MNRREKQIPQPSPLTPHLRVRVDPDLWNETRVPPYYDYSYIPRDERAGSHSPKPTHTVNLKHAYFTEGPYRANPFLGALAKADLLLYNQHPFLRLLIHHGNRRHVVTVRFNEKVNRAEGVSGLKRNFVVVDIPDELKAEGYTKDIVAAMAHELMRHINFVTLDEQRGGEVAKSARASSYQNLQIIHCNDAIQRAVKSWKAKLPIE